MAHSHGKTLTLSAQYAIGNVARRGVHLVMLPLYTAYLTTADFGVYALLILAGVFISALICTPLITGGLMRFYYHPSYREKQGVLLFNTTIVLAILSAGVAAAWYFTAGPLASILLDDVAHVRVVMLFSLLALLSPIHLLVLSLMNLRQMGRYFIVVCLAEALVTVAVVVVALVYLKLGVAALVLGGIGGMASTVLLGLPVLLVHMRFRLRLGVLAEPLRFGIPLLPEGVSRLVLLLGDRYVLRLFLPLGQVGLYAMGWSLSEVIDTAIGTPVYNGVNPTIRQLEHEPDQQRRFIRSSATMFYALTVFAGLVLSLYAREVVMLLTTGREFWPCWTVVPVVTFAFVLQALGAFLDWGMIMKNKAYHISGAVLVAAGVNIGLNLLLIPYYGIMGAAVATCVSQLLWNVLKGYFSWRLHDVRLDLLRLGHITIIAVGVYLLSMAVATSNSLLLNIAIKAALAAGFLVLCYTTGVLSAAQKKLLHGFVRRARANGLMAEIRRLSSSGGEDE